MQKESRVVHFPGITGLRFVAASIVAICHVEQRKRDLGFNSYIDKYFFYNTAGLAVTLFFVLSGFLITYLLLQEKRKYGTISLQKFYLRRILRLWPLYYFVIILACFVLPHFSFLNLPGTNAYDGNFSLKILLLFLILPNVVHMLGMDIPYSGQTWSIGVEEQFYFIWPLIVQRVKKYYLVLMALIVLVVMCSNGFLYVSNHFFTAAQKQSSSLYKIFHFIGLYFAFFRISAMAIGGIGACLVIFDHPLKKLIVNRVVEIGAWMLVIISIIMKVSIFYVYHEVYSCLFLAIIMNAASGRSIFHFFLDHPVITYFGKISYGIYMYHGLVVVLMVKALNLLAGFSFNVTQTVVLDVLVLAGTILVAGASYEFFEKPMIKLKDKFQRIRSTPKSIPEAGT